MSLSQPSLPARPAKIVCIGDIHGQWNDGDEQALTNLNPDLALFVGDYGDEDIHVTTRISHFASSCNFSVATVFGNHDAFYTQSYNGRKRAPYDRNVTCRVTDQMQLLEPYDVSYKSLDMSDFHLSVCGGRSFSIGGPNWKFNDFYKKYIGVQGMNHSANKIKQAVQSASYNTVIFLSHSGPCGLGGKPSDPCGKDWGEQPGGDYGDEDLRAGIEHARRNGRHVPLTVFGHMHNVLYGNQGFRTMIKTEPDGESGYETVMLNAAVVPRHRIGAESNATLHHFQIVELGESGYVDSVHEAWVLPDGQVKESKAIFEATLPVR